MYFCVRACLCVCIHTRGKKNKNKNPDPRYKYHFKVTDKFMVNVFFDLKNNLSLGKKVMKSRVLKHQDGKPIQN